MHRFKLVLISLGAIALVMAPTGALAAPAYLASDPEDGAELDSAPDNVRVIFDQPLEPGGSLIVADACDRRIDDGSPTVIGSTISVGIAKTPSGVYTAIWKVRAPGGVGGGDAGGLIKFTVTSGEPCGPKTGDHSGHVDGEHGGRHHGDHGSRDHSDHDDDADHSGHVAGIDHSSHTVAGEDHSQHVGGAGEKPKQQDPQPDGQPPIDAPPSDIAPLAGGIGSGPGEIPGSMVLTALLMCLLLGAAGGWVVRNLTPR